MQLTIITISIHTYLAWNCALVRTLLGVSKFDFLTILCPRKNSAQIQNFTSWHFRAEFLKSAFIKRYKAFISGMTDFAHLNNYIILLANLKL